MMSTKTMSRPVVGNLRQRVEAVLGGDDLAALLREQGLGGAADRLAVIDDHHLEAGQALFHGEYPR